MAGYIWAFPGTHFRSIVTVASSPGDLSGFPATNIKLYSRPNIPWISSDTPTVTTNTWIGVDLGTVPTIPTVTAIVIDNINISSLIIETGTNISFSSITANSGAITVNQNAVDGRYKLFYVPTGSLATAHQYWRVRSLVGVRTDGTQGPMSVGSVTFLTGTLTWAMGSAEYDETPIQSVLPNDNFAGGGAAPIILGNPTAGITLNAQAIAPQDRTLTRADLLTVLRQSIGSWMVFFRNNGDPSDVYICRRTSDLQVRQTFPSVIEYQSLTLEGAV